MAKGGNFEREISKALSKWWTDGERDDVFWRTAGSGGMATNRQKRSKNAFGQYGDIQATDPIGQPLMDCLTIECKAGYSNWNILEVLDKAERHRPKKFEEFVEQAKSDSIAADVPYWILITKRNAKVECIFMPRKLYKDIHSVHGSPTFKYTPLALSIGLYPDVIMGIRLSTFFNWVEPDFFLYLSEEISKNKTPRMIRRRRRTK